MSKCIMTVCTADYFQHYIPVFVWSILNTWKDVDVVIYLTGKMDHTTKLALTQFENVMHVFDRLTIIEDYKTNYPMKIGTANALRFVTKDLGYDETFVTDVDMFFCKQQYDIFEWCSSRKIDNCYVGYHSPLYKPYRPEICKKWEESFERIAAGFVMLYRGWWIRTGLDIRRKWDEVLKRGDWGHFRESDEVMLCRMVKEAGLFVNQVPLDKGMRPLHLGDFKPSMKHRYTNRIKMRVLLSDVHVKAFLSALKDKTFSNILDILSEDAQITHIMNNVAEYCKLREAGEM